MNFYKDIYTKRWRNIEKVNQIWKVLVEDFFQPMIPYESKVLDVGCGFCYFLNHLQVKEKVGVDANPSASNYAASDVIFYCTDDLTLPMLPNDYFDFVFISNFFS